MTESDARALLARRVAEAGGQKPFGRLHGIAASYVNRVLAGASMGASILNALGLEKITSYRKVTP